MSNTDSPPSVKVGSFAEVLCDYALADEGRPVLLKTLQEMRRQPHTGDYARQIMKTLTELEWQGHGPSRLAKTLIADLLFEELEENGYQTDATFLELYKTCLLLSSIAYRGTSGMFHGFKSKNLRMEDGLLEKALKKLESSNNTNIPSKQIEALKDAAKLQGAVIPDLLGFLVRLEDENHTSHIERSIRLAKHYLDNDVAISRDDFLAML